VWSGEIVMDLVDAFVERLVVKESMNPVEVKVFHDQEETALQENGWAKGV
jgi:hypothetical protein